MFNKKVIEKKTRKDALGYLNLFEKKDKFTGLITLEMIDSPLGIYEVNGVEVGFKEARLIPAKSGFQVVNLSTVRLKRVTQETNSSIVMEWNFQSDPEQSDIRNGLITITELKILRDGQVDSIELNAKRNNATVILDQKLIKNILDAKELEIRLLTNQGSIDYDPKASKKFQTLIKELVEKVSDLDEYDVIKVAEKLNPSAQSESKVETPKKKSKILSLVKWFFLILLGIAIFNAIVGKSPSSKDSTPPKVVEQPVAESKQEAPKEQEQPVSKEGSPQAESK